MVVGESLPAILLDRLGGGGLATSTAVPVCTIDGDGFAHPAMLSYGALSADGDRFMRAAVYGSSSTARNLRERHRMTLLFVDHELTCYVKTSVTGLDEPHDSVPGIVVFPLSVDAVLLDRVDTSREPDATIVSGITFRRTAPGATT
jgi:hypothetical protein